METKVGDCGKVEGWCYSIKEGRKIDEKIDTSVLIFIWKCQEDADNLICRHYVHEKGLDDDDKSVCVFSVRFIAVIYT